MKNTCAIKNDLNLETENRDHLDYIKWQLRNNYPIVQIHGIMKLTKTQTNYVEASFLRDLELEEDVKYWIHRRSSLSKIIDRYYKYDRNLPSFTWPQHYPMRFLSGVGSVCSSDNIFMFFPEVLGISTGLESDYFGFEFVDIWLRVFEEVVIPCVQRTFAKPHQVSLAQKLHPSLAKTIYLAAVFHEIGHRVGPWKVSPKIDERLRINQHNLDIMGELATDSLLVIMLEEFPEVAQFVLYQRLFWFTRREYRNNPLSSNINTDNDAWIGSFLWNKAQSENLITELNGKLHVNEKQIPTFFKSILAEIDALGEQVLIAPSYTIQNQLIMDWRKDNVQMTNSGQFLLSKTMQRAFKKCQNITYTPHFSPILSNR